jgi:hypothetical protein
MQKYPVKSYNNKRGIVESHMNSKAYVVMAVLSTALIASMFAYPLQVVEAQSTVENEHEHTNENKNSVHGNDGIAVNVGGSDGFHGNQQTGFNDNKGDHIISHSHSNIKDR